MYSYRSSTCIHQNVTCPKAKSQNEISWFLDNHQSVLRVQSHIFLFLLDQQPTMYQFFDQDADAMVFLVIFCMIRWEEYVYMVGRLIARLVNEEIQDFAWTKCDSHLLGPDCCHHNISSLEVCVKHRQEVNVLIIITRILICLLIMELKPLHIQIPKMPTSL